MFNLVNITSFSLSYITLIKLAFFMHYSWRKLQHAFYSGKTRSLNWAGGWIAFIHSFVHHVFNKMFSIVKFKSDHSVQVVSSNWLTDDKKFCYWPPGPTPNPTPKIKKHLIPSINWQKLDVTFWKSTGKCKTFQIICIILLNLTFFNIMF